MFSSGEYTNAYASPYSEYTHLGHYYKGAQFGPKLPASVPSNAYPTILRQGNEFGYDALTHDTDGTNYYNVEKAYGTSCEPKYYVAKCPENKFIRPFVPDGHSDMGPPTPCPVRNEPIAEGFETPTPSPHLLSELQRLKVVFFYDKACRHSQQAFDMYQKELYPTPLHKAFFSIKDISQFNHEKMLTDLGGTATPFFFSQATNRSVTGYVPLEALVAGLHGHGKPSSHESYHHSGHIATASPLKDLGIVVFVMQGCVYCDKLKALLAQHGVDKQVQFVDARDPKHRQELAHVRGFPHYKSTKTGKSSTGYPGSLEKMIASLQ